MDAAVVNVDLEPSEPGTLRVAWQLTGPAAVDVAIGATPEAIDHVHSRTVDEQTTSIDLPVDTNGPHFVSVAPTGTGGAMVAGARLVALEGLQNFRDMGGYASTLGGRTRWGRLFRADSLHKLTAVDRDALARLGLRTVADLRSDKERASHPNPLDNIQYEIIGRPRRVEGDDPPMDLSTVDGEHVLRDIYVGSLVHSAHLFGALLASFAGPEGLPAVFHCHAGKDRTGVVAALVLLAVGVEREVVLDDYELTRRYRTFENQQDSYANMIALGMSPEAAAGVLSTPRWAMEDALDSLEADHGGIERYLTTTAGLTHAQLDALRTALIA